jgi:hypothetical protein
MENFDWLKSNGWFEATPGIKGCCEESTLNCWFKNLESEFPYLTLAGELHTIEMQLSYYRIYSGGGDPKFKLNLVVRPQCGQWMNLSVFEILSEELQLTLYSHCQDLVMLWDTINRHHAA